MRPGLDLLSQLPLLAGAEERHLQHLNEASDLARFGPHEEVLAQGDIPAELIFLIHGSLACAHDSEGGRKLTNVIVPPRGIAIPASMLGLRAHCSYFTMTSARLILMPVAVVRSLSEEDGNLARSLAQHAFQELLQAEREIHELKTATSAQRLARYLLEFTNGSDETPVRFMLPFEKRFLAGKIGCTQESLSRTFGLLRKEGVDTSQSGAVVIRDIVRLRKFAGLPT